MNRVKKLGLMGLALTSVAPLVMLAPQVPAQGRDILEAEEPLQATGRTRSGGATPMPPELALMRGYLSLVEHFTYLAKDPSAAGVAAVFGASDLLKREGPGAVAKYFKEVLPDVKDKAVERAVRLQLVDAYKQTGQTEDAMEQLRILMTAAPEK